MASKVSATTEKDLYWAIKSAQSDGLSLDEFLKTVRDFWISEREEQLFRERNRNGQ